MQAHYKMQLETEALTIKGDQFMEREQYQNQIKDLLQAVETLLKSNKAMGEKLDKATAAYDDLEAKYEKLEGELAMHKRGQYRKGGEKPMENATSDMTGTGAASPAIEALFEWKLNKIGLKIIQMCRFWLKDCNGLKKSSYLCTRKQVSKKTKELWHIISNPSRRLLAMWHSDSTRELQRLRLTVVLLTSLSRWR